MPPVAPDQFVQHGALGVLALMGILFFGLLGYGLRALIQLGERGVAALEKMPKQVHDLSEQVVSTSGSHTNMLLQLLTAQKATQDRVEFIASRGCPYTSIITQVGPHGPTG